MSQNSLKHVVLQKVFEYSKRANQDGIEFWYARVLMGHFGYVDWVEFNTLIERAKSACETSGQTVGNHFHKITRVLDGTGPAVEDYELTRYACYLVALNGDPSTKESVAVAQSYFAIQTRKQERTEEANQYLERIEARERLTQEESNLSTLLYERGFDGRDIAIVRSRGDKALFTRSTGEMKQELGVPDNRVLADFLPAVTLSAKAFATSMTNHTTKDKGIQHKNAITEVHESNNASVRNLLVRKGIRPEKLPPSEDIRKLEKRIQPSGTRKLKSARS